jgi:hypothetical protein
MADPGLLKTELSKSLSCLSDNTNVGKSNNVEFVQYCGGHFENGDR